MKKYFGLCPLCKFIVMEYTRKPKPSDTIDDSLIKGSKAFDRYPRCKCGYQLEYKDFCEKLVMEIEIAGT